MCDDNKVKITIQKAGKRADNNFKKRMINIKFFASLNRIGFTHKLQAPSLKIYETSLNEKIYIKYPGKESDIDRASPKPWDFRPILIKNNIQMKDLSFGEIWEFISKFVHNSSNGDKKENTILLARLFYKVAFLNLHTLITNSSIFSQTTLHPDNYKLYLFDNRCNNLTINEKNILSKVIETIDINGNQMNISVESFILYNELLCSNEDCKYFYRANKTLTKSKKVLDDHFETVDGIKKLKKLEWEGLAGRINTFLTHINFLAYLAKKKDIFHLLEEASRGQGIFPISNNQELVDFLNEFA